MGCGTGLSGSLFRDVSDHLTGVDLSPVMLTRAREKKIYDDLSQEEIVTFLRDTGGRYDLFVAADVFVYSGDLFPVLEEISRHAQPGALLLFSTELAEKGFLLKETGRYAHSTGYLIKTAEQCGLRLRQSRTTGMRKERGQ